MKYEIKEILKFKKIKNKKRELTLIIVSTIVITLFFSGYSIGKGVSKTTINTNAQIAKPILIVENDKTIDITGKDNIGYYEFKIKNYNNQEEINQVDLKYNIEILSDTDETIDIKLYKDNEEVYIEKNKTQDEILDKGIKKEISYKLQITYDKSKSESIEDIIQKIQLKIHSEQLKTQDKEGYE